MYLGVGQFYWPLVDHFCCPLTPVQKTLRLKAIEEYYGGSGLIDLQFSDRDDMAPSAETVLFLVDKIRERDEEIAALKQQIQESNVHCVDRRIDHSPRLFSPHTDEKMGVSAGVSSEQLNISRVDPTCH